MPQITTFKTAAITGTGTGDNTIVAGVAGFPLRVWKIFFTAAGAVNVTFKDGAGTSLSGAFILPANGSQFVLHFDGAPHFVTSLGNAFIINSSQNVALTGMCYYSVG